MNDRRCVRNAHTEKLTMTATCEKNQLIYSRIHCAKIEFVCWMSRKKFIGFGGWAIRSATAWTLWLLETEIFASLPFQRGHVEPSWFCARSKLFAVVKTLSPPRSAPATASIPPCRRLFTSSNGFVRAPVRVRVGPCFDTSNAYFTYSLPQNSIAQRSADFFNYSFW